jgi:hypothetical protein
MSDLLCGVCVKADAVSFALIILFLACLLYKKITASLTRCDKLSLSKYKVM